MSHQHCPPARSHCLKKALIRQSALPQAPATGQTVDRGHLLSRAGSAAGDGSAAPSIASTPRHSTVHRLESGAVVGQSAGPDARADGRPHDVDGSDRVLALLSASEQPDLRAYVNHKLDSVSRILNGGERSGEDADCERLLSACESLLSACILHLARIQWCRAPALLLHQ